MEIITSIFPTEKSKNQNSKNNFIDLTNDEGKELTEDLISNYMNEYFTEIGSKLSAKITTSNCNYLSDMERSEYSDVKLINWRPVNIEEIELLIEEIDTTKNSSIPEIDIVLFKDSLKAIPEKLLFLFTKDLEESVVPDSWKVGCVVPL